LRRKLHLLTNDIFLASETQIEIFHLLQMKERRVRHALSCHFFAYHRLTGRNPFLSPSLRFVSFPVPRFSQQSPISEEGLVAIVYVDKCIKPDPTLSPLLSQW
jgi:hypothetical protein